MSNHRTFADRVLSGEVYDLDVIDDEIAAWHEAGGAGCDLHEWLGLTEAEYALFVEQPAALRPIFAARKYHLDIAEFLQLTDKALPLAARGASTEEILSLVSWLKQTRRI
jgi:hypothetical protein